MLKMFILGLLICSVAASGHVSTKNSIRRRRDDSTTDPLNFASPNGMCNVTLVIGGKKIIVSKEFLAIHSSVLSELFSEKENQEVEIKDVDYDEFVSLLQVIFPGRPNPITDTTVLPILALGSRFQIERALDLTEKHLMSSTQLSIPAKLQMADQHGLTKLRSSNLQAYTSLSKLGSLQSTPEYSTFSDSMKAALCDRMMEMIKSRDF